MENNLSLNEADSVSISLNDKQIAVTLEAIEEITNKKLKQLDSSYIEFVEKFI